MRECLIKAGTAECNLNGGGFETNQLLFADDTALLVDSKEKLCRLESEFGRLCEGRNLRADVGRSKVTWSSKYGNGVECLHVILNGEPLEEVDCFKYLGSQVAADGGFESNVVHIMNEECISWGALRNCAEQ